MTSDTLRNAFLQLVVCREGAELRSITDSHGTEYLWQGDPLVWSGRSPILFPIVGKLAGDSYTHAGRTYKLPQHGFARRKEFRLIASGRNSLYYSLRHDDGTRQVYPFAFDLVVSYRLDGNVVHVGYRVTNIDREAMPFSIGGHPGFSCCWGTGDALEDFYLEFERTETAESCLVKDGLLALHETKRVLTGEGTLPLTRTLFDQGALVFTDLKSSSVTLRSQRRPYAVKVGFAGFPCLGVWSKPAAPFVCIEPWFGHADPAGRDPGAAIAAKPGIILLPPGVSFACGWQAGISS